MAANAYGWVTNPSQSRVGYDNSSARNDLLQQQGESAFGLQGQPNQNFNYGPPPPMNQGYAPPTQFARGYDPSSSNFPDFFSPGKGFGELNSFSQYQDKDMRAALNSYANNYAIPASNLALQRNDQSFNQAYQTANFGEQQRMNNYNMGLQGQANWRENTGLQFSMDKYKQDFGENQRQFNQGMGFNYAQLQGQNQYQQGQLQNTQFANQTQRQDVQNQYQLGMGRNQNEATGIANQYRLGQMQNTTAQRGQTLDYQLGSRNADINAQNVSNQFNLGKMQDTTTQRGQDYNYQLGQGQNDIQRRNVEGTLALGQGRLGLDTRQLSLDDQYRYRALQQEDALTRQRLANEMTQSRYAAFGRAQQPNFRMMNSYR